MSSNNGVIRIDRKGTKKFAFGDGDPFEVDVVTAFQEWINVDESFREANADRNIPNADMHAYHHSAVAFVRQLSGIDVGVITVAEALDFLARLRECYDELAVFFLPRSRERRDSLDSSGVELRFSEEES